MTRSFTGARRWVAAICLFGAGVVSACSDGTAPAAPPDFVSQFDAVWSSYDLTYPYFDYKHVNWDSLRTVYRPRAAAAKSEQELANVVRDMLAELRDLHAWLTTPSGSTLPTYVSTAFVNWRSSVWQSYLPRLGWHQQNTNWGYGTIGGIPYLAFGAWNTAQFTSAAVDAALEQFKNAPAMVIDVRMNGGGNSSLALSIASRFYDSSRVVTYVQYRNGPNHSNLGTLQPNILAPHGPWQFRNPVLLLVGRGCFSSNETFIAAMGQLPNVTIVGDTTGGASGNPAPFDLGGGWQYTVPRWIEYTTDLQVIEWKGIAPKIVVPAGAADFDAGRDPVLDHAARWADSVMALHAARN